MQDILKCCKVNSKGFGTVPKLVMQDRRLCAAAKAVYAYFCSYAGGGDCCFPSRKKICFDLNISQDSLGKYLKELTTCGYLLIEQTKENGRFGRNIYTLCENVESIVETVENTSPAPKSPLPKISVTEKTVTEKIDTNNNREENKQYSNNIISYQERQPETKQDTIGYDETKEQVKEQIEYECIKTADNALILNDIVLLLADTLSSNKSTLVIGKSEIGAITAKQRLLSLNAAHIEYVIDRFKETKTQIRNVRQYLLAMLYNAPATMDSYYTAKVNSDLAGLNLKELL